MKNAVALTVAAGALLVAATSAQAASCTEFMSMDAAGQAAAAASMALPSDLNPASDDSTAADAQVAAVRSACEAHPDMDAEDAMGMMGS